MYAVLAGPEGRKMFFGDGPNTGNHSNSPTFRRLRDGSSIYCHVNKHYLKKNYPIPSSMDQIVKITNLPRFRDDTSVIIPDYEFYRRGNLTYRVDREKKTIECRYLDLNKGWFTSNHSWEAWKTCKKQRIKRLVVENMR